MKDLLDREIQVGQFIAGAQRSGNSGTLTIGKVLEVHENEIKVLVAKKDYFGMKLNSKPGVWYYPDRMVIVEPTEELRRLYE